MRTQLLNTALVTGTLFFASPSCQDPSPKTSPTKRPVDVFAELDGTWKGTFVGYDDAGKELYRIRVQQDYKTIDANTQRVSVTDTMPDGKVITGKGENRATRLKDGSLELLCVVDKSNGEQVEHKGRLVKGPGGQQQLVWYSKADKKIETFREWVVGHGKDAVYHIQGMGKYGDSLMLMAGEYHR